MTDHAIDPSVTVHVAVCPSSGVVALAHERAVVIAYSLSDEQQNAAEVHSFSVAHTIRCMCFLHESNGLLAVGGDGKAIEVFDISDRARDAVKVAQYGPHAKRITNLAAIRKTNAFCFADKFGEVFLMRFSDPSEPSAGFVPAPVFLMQHMAIVTEMLITSPALVSGRRLLTADRDSHLRVSKFPNAFEIENFLWRNSPQAPISALTEIVAGAPSATSPEAEGSLVVGAGDVAGAIHMWRVHDSGETSSIPTSFAPFGAPVLAMCSLRCPRSASALLLMAVDKSRSLHYVHVVNSAAGISVGSLQKLALPNLNDSVAALNGGKEEDASAIALLRSGAVVKVAVVEDGTTPTLELLPVQHKALQDACAAWGPQLCDADFLAVWRSPFTDGRGPKGADNGSDNDDRGEGAEKRAKPEA